MVAYTYKINPQNSHMKTFKIRMQVLRILIPNGGFLYRQLRKGN